MFIALLILAVTIALFIWEPIPIVVTAIGASILYAYTVTTVLPLCCWPE